MSNLLSVSIIQAPLHWEDINANLQLFTGLIQQTPPADLYVLPETFTTGFSMKPELAVESYKKGLDWMQQTAKEKNAAICGSMLAEENGRHYNRMVFMKPDGNYDTYNKKHLFTLGNEGQYFTPGTERVIVEYKGWRILPLVCYDLRFPVWSRNSNNDAYDMLLYSANWPEKRSHHWRSLLIARAIENQCCVAACNRIGTDGNGMTYNGNSMLIDHTGQVIQENTGETAILNTVFDRDKMLEYRSGFPVLADADRFTLL